MENTSPKENKKKGYFKLDIILFVLWLVLMWGFLALISFVPSPKDAPGIHEIATYIYFFGVSFILLFIYVYAIKKKI